MTSDNIIDGQEEITDDEEKINLILNAALILLKRKVVVNFSPLLPTYFAGKPAIHSKLRLIRG